MRSTELSESDSEEEDLNPDSQGKFVDSTKMVRSSSDMGDASTKKKPKKMAKKRVKFKDQAKGGKQILKPEASILAKGRNKRDKANRVIDISKKKGKKKKFIQRSTKSKLEHSKF